MVDNLRNHWSANFGMSGRFHRNTHRKKREALPVGIFANRCPPEGISDIATNIWEWCWDWFNKNYYQICAQRGVVKDPCGPENGNARIVRGGSFFYEQNSLRCASRLRFKPNKRIYFVGFRVVWS